MMEEYKQNKRKMIGIAVILFLMFINRFFWGPFPKISLNILIWVTYSIILVIPQSWWTRRKLIIASTVILIETAAGVYWFQEMFLIYLLFIFIFYSTIRISLSKSPVPVIVAMFLASMLYIRFGSGNIFSIVSFIFLTIVLYFAVRLRLQRNEMYLVNQQQLEELKEAYQQLQEASVTSMRYAVLEERTRIAREIHDAVGHSLTSLIVQMQALKYMVKRNPEEADHSIEMMLAVARQGLNDIRTSVHSLAENQVISGITPLKALLSRMEATASIQYEFHSDLNDEEQNITMDGLMFRVLQEAITNIIRYSKATLVTVSLEKAEGNIVMRIKDNGKLELKDGISEGFGLKAMKARLGEIGGKLNYKILEPRGFEIEAEIPLNDHEQNEG